MSKEGVSEHGNSQVQVSNSRIGDFIQIPVCSEESMKKTPVSLNT